MQRILDPAQIEAFAQRAIPRIRLPDKESVFAARARRLRELSASDAVGHSIAAYLRLMAHVADAQQAALASFNGALPEAERVEQARRHRMPVLHAVGWPRDASWREALKHLCGSVAALPDYPSNVRDVCLALANSQPEALEARADALLGAAAHPTDVDAATAPFVMAALQAYWVHLASRLDANDVTALDVPGVCPVCGTLPITSVVRADKRAQGYRYLHCALCATEWHMVRITCSQCQANQNIAYHSIEGGPEAIRAESCDACKTYRKILYQEKDPAVEPVADDLASLALDLLMSEAGYHRGSGNPLLWQRSE
jgi:FdhE protein